MENKQKLQDMKTLYNRSFWRDEDGDASSDRTSAYEILMEIVEKHEEVMQSLQQHVEELQDRIDYIEKKLNIDQV